METEQIFKSFWQGGFECSTHRHADGRRLDLLAQTRHDEFCLKDFRRLSSLGIQTVRTGARWHLIEANPSNYCFDSLLPTIKAAEKTGLQILLDLFHFGWPDHLDIFDPTFPDRFGQYTRAVARFLKPYRHLFGAFAPVNEISFFAWAGGAVAHINPHATGRSDELKRILVRAAVIGSEILLNECCAVRLIAPEPAIHVAGDPTIPGDEHEAAAFSAAQYQSWDMLSGRSHPELGGRPEYLDIIGVNFYEQNQWLASGERLAPTDSRFKPFRKMLQEVWERYRRPMFVSETGTEDLARVEWFNYICREVTAAHDAGVPVHGICLYPILNHPGWDNDRHCYNGLFDYADENGDREVYLPLAEALRHQQGERYKNVSHPHDNHQLRSDLFFPSALGIRLSETSTSDEPLRAARPGLLL